MLGTEEENPLSENWVVLFAGLVFDASGILVRCHPQLRFYESSDPPGPERMASDLIQVLETIAADGASNSKHNREALTKFIRYLFESSGLPDSECCFGSMVPPSLRLRLAEGCIHWLRWLDIHMQDIEDEASKTLGVSIPRLVDEWEMTSVEVPEIITSVVHLWEYSIGDICSDDPNGNADIGLRFVDFGRDMVRNSRSRSLALSCVNMFTRLGWGSALVREQILLRLPGDIKYCAKHRHPDISNWYLRGVQRSLSSCSDF